MYEAVVTVTFKRSNAIAVLTFSTYRLAFIPVSKFVAKSTSASIRFLAITVNTLFSADRFAIMAFPLVTIITDTIVVFALPFRTAGNFATRFTGIALISFGPVQIRIVAQVAEALVWPDAGAIKAFGIANWLTNIRGG